MAEVISFADRRAAKVAAEPQPVVAEVKAAPAPTGLLVNEDQVFDYDGRMKAAVRGIIRGVLSDVSKHGLPQQAKLLIAFNTQHPGVEIPQHLRDAYPVTMTILFDGWWKDLEVTKEGFSVTMNFANCETRLVVPFLAVEQYTDPSAELVMRLVAPTAAARLPEQVH